MATATLEKPTTYKRGSHVSRKRGRKRDEIIASAERRRLQMLAWRAMGYGVKDIAEACGVGISYVCQELKRAGYVRPARNLPPLPKKQQSA